MSNIKLREGSFEALVLRAEVSGAAYVGAVEVVVVVGVGDAAVLLERVVRARHHLTNQRRVLCPALSQSRLTW